MNVSSNNTIQVRVLAASTGQCYPITVPFEELTVRNIQRHLAAVIPKEDQILLLGPPFKVPKDTSIRSNDTLESLRKGDLEDDPTYFEDGDTNVYKNENDADDDEKSKNAGITKQPRLKRKPVLGATERSGSRRLFLFSKQALSDSAPEPTPCVLSPLDVQLPLDPDPSPITYTTPNMESSTVTSTTIISAPGEPSSSLQQALSVYERGFMTDLCHGRAYADAADMRLEACRRCVLEQAVMVRALRAAVSNLADHWNNAMRTRAEFTSLYTEKNEEHGKILNGIDGVLEKLSEIPLHEELKNIARMNGRIMLTLLDTVPIEHERKWAAQCQTSFTRLQNFYEELKSEFDLLTSSTKREEEAKSDLEAEDMVKKLDLEVEDLMVGLRDKQSSRLNHLTNDHMKVVSIVLNTIKDESQVHIAFTNLEAMKKSSTSILPEMQADDLKLKEIMIKVASAKTDAMKRMNLRLRQISQAQLKIQRLMKRTNGLHAALEQQCVDVSHLDHLFELPRAYRDFIMEIKRRKSYGEAINSISNAMYERLTSIRNEEISARERFLRGPGRHLMPIFFDTFVPTLAAAPDPFNQRFLGLTELDSLPVFAEGDTSIDSDTPIQKNVSTSVGADNVESSLTESVSKVEGDEGDVTSSLSRLSVSRNQEDAPDSPLIVSAECQSGGGDIIMNSHNDSQKLEHNAENKILSYENNILRSKLAELTGKSPQAYIEKELEEKDLDKQTEKLEMESLQKELSQMKKELDLAKSQLKRATDDAMAKEKAMELSDKISHSSFNIGDVALFMPTGKNAGGKKAFLAFHTNCPHRYLSTDSIHKNPDYVLGRIIAQQEYIAGAIGTDQNPHGLRVGTKFWILTVERLI